MGSRCRGDAAPSGVARRVPSRRYCAEPKDLGAAPKRNRERFHARYQWCAAAFGHSQGVSKMLVALSRFTIANGMADEVRAAFRRRPHLVDRAPGFLGMEVMSPVGDAAEIWLVTRWCDEQSYRNWHHGHDYHESHKGIPKGLKLVPKSTEIRLFDVFSN